MNEREKQLRHIDKLEKEALELEDEAYRIFDDGLYVSKSMPPKVRKAVKTLRTWCRDMEKRVEKLQREADRLYDKL